MILFCNVNTRNKLVELPQKIIPYLIMEWKYAIAPSLEYLCVRVWNNLTVQHAALSLGKIWSIRFFQFIYLSILIPRNFVFIVDLNIQNFHKIKND
jgi:hypothetical protein